jgi:hypothetical protein
MPEVDINGSQKSTVTFFKYTYSLKIKVHLTFKICPTIKCHLTF